MKRVGKAWGTLGAAEAAAWDAFGKTIQKRNPVNDVVYSPSGYNAFSGLALRLVQIDPLASIPAWPPTSRFAGDKVAITVSAEETPSPWKATPKDSPDASLSSPPSADPPTVPPSGKAFLTFSASGANAPGTLTEMLVERIPNVRRKPTEVYKCAGFAAFSEGSLSVALPVEAGVYACAVRFVERATGQATAIQALGVVTANLFSRKDV